ncbi:MAG TPA: ferredoxin [Marmoricola sp.]|jgi:ferredoxin|nr:ferredoxin [Marmoricola sp.]
MRLTVDHDKCQGHSLCANIAPDLFELDDDTGQATASPDPVPDALLPSARQAASSCPESAIGVRLR